MQRENVMAWWIGIACGIVILSFVMIHQLSVVLVKKNILDIPNARSSHHAPVPRGGGLVFVVLFYAALVLLFMQHLITKSVLFSLLGGMLVAAVGYCDDMWHVKARWRAVVQMIAAAWGIYWLGGIHFLYMGSETLHFPILFSFLAVITTVWFINLYNFMDGIDGLAGMEAVFVSICAGVILLCDGYLANAFVCFAIALPVLSFLFFNWSPAKIFMGDVGSGFLGFIFADMMWITNNQHQLSLPAWWILLSVFIFDASYTLICRIIQKKQWYLAHREHAYQRLIQSRFSHKQVTTIIFLINILICLPTAVIYLNLNRIMPDVILLFTMSIVFFFSWFMISKKYNVTMSSQ